MKMKIFVKGIVATLMSGIVLATASLTTAFAVTEGSDSDVASYVKNGSAASDGRFTKASDFSGSSDGYSVYYDSAGVGYYIKTADEGTVASAVRKSNNQQGAKDVEDKLSEVQDDLGLQADTKNAGVAMSGFAGVLSTLLGFLVILIGGYLTIQTALDVCYVAFPVFRGKCDDMKQKGAAGGGGLASAATKQGKDGETKLRLISDDAIYAVQSTNTTETGKNPFTTYLVKRIWAFMLVAVVLYIFVSGNVFTFTKLAVKLVSGLIELINGLI